MNHKERKKLRRKLEQELSEIESRRYRDRDDLDRRHKIRQMLGLEWTFETIAQTSINHETGEITEVWLD